MQLAACAGTSVLSPEANPAEPTPPVQTAPEEARPLLPPTPPAKEVIKTAPRRVPETDPKLAIEAEKKIKRAKALYTTGQYDEAEDLLKKSITTFPFLADAQLLLGKIFLIKGSATRDVALLNSARLMFEMAAAIDPGRAEVQTLLELFSTQYPE